MNVIENATGVRLPDFLIIGAAKSATTSLADYLQQHPEVFIPPRNKEPNYFAFQGETLPPPGPASPEILHHLWYSHCVTKYPDYVRLFEPVRENQAAGEASVRYLYYPEAAGRIRETIPDVRLVAILREPISRLYSHYCMNVQYQLENLSLSEALAAEEERRSAGWGWDWHYVNVSLYSRQLKRYYELFSPEQIRVFLYDDFVRDPTRVFQEICRHIGVNDRFVPDMSKRGKVAYRPRNLLLDRWLHWPRLARPGVEKWIPRRLPESMILKLEQWNSSPIPRMDNTLRQQLRELFTQDVKELGELIQRKVPWYD